MRLGLRTGLGTVLLVFAAGPLACSGKVTGDANDGGTSGSSSGSGASGSGSGSGSGSSSGVISSSSSGGSSGGTSSSGSGSGGTGIVPPPPPSGPTTTLTAPHNYAVHQLYLGDTDRMGVTNPDAWRSFGYDLDGKITTAASTDVCTLIPGASKIVQVDGNGGIDNSWGSDIMPILGTLDSTFSQTENNVIQSGGGTPLFYVVGFDDSAGNMTTATGLSGSALAGANYPMAHGGMLPTWDLNTHWPVAPESLNCFPSGGADGCTTSTDPIAAADVRFPAAFQTQGTFVNGTPSSLTLRLAIGGNLMVLNLHSAVVTFDPQMPGAVTNGTIAGAIDTAELITALKLVAGHISTALCSGSAFQSIASQIEQTSDIVLSGDTVSNSPGTACNAISIGLGFDAIEIAPPTGADIAPQTPPGPDPCGDGG